MNHSPSSVKTLSDEQLLRAIDECFQNNQLAASAITLGVEMTRRMFKDRVKGREATQANEEPVV